MLETLQTLVSSQGQGYTKCIGKDGLEFFLSYSHAAAGNTFSA